MASYTANENRQKPYRVRERVWYAVNHSYPYVVDGYAVRTHGVATGLSKSGIEVIVSSKLPRVNKENSVFVHDCVAEKIISNVRYVYIKNSGDDAWISKQELLKTIDVVIETLRVFKPSVVVAASNWKNAFPNAIAARSLGIPFYYEVRGFWEISKASVSPEWEKTEEYCKVVENETDIIREADGIFTINRFMKEELVKRGARKDKIALVPNGFPGWPKNHPKNLKAKWDLGIKTKYIIGYVGTFNVYEGLEDLIRSFAILRRNGVNASLVLVGSSKTAANGSNTYGECEATATLRSLAEQHEIEKYVFFPGRIDVEDIPTYYAMIDLVVIPRKACKVSEIVSPMKPIEAASYGKQVLMSDVGPLADLEGLCKNFHTYKKNDVNALAEQMKNILSMWDSTLFKCNALEQYTWEKNVKPMIEMFNSLN